MEQSNEVNYLSSQPNIGKDKMEVLKELIVEFGYFNNRLSHRQFLRENAEDFVKREKFQPLIESLFSQPAAQPTELTKFLKLLIEGDGRIVSEHSLSPDQIDAANVSGRRYPYLEDHALVFMPDDEPAQPLEPTEDIKDWIESETGNYNIPDWVFNIHKDIRAKVVGEIWEGFKAGADAMYSHLQPKIAELEEWIAIKETNEGALTQLLNQCERKLESKEPAPTDWEKDFTRFLSEDCSIYVSFEILNDIINFIKQRVPKTVVAGMRWVICTKPPKEKDDYAIRHIHSGKKWSAYFGGLKFEFLHNGKIMTKPEEWEYLDESPSLSSLIEQVRELQAWKESAIAVMPDMQAIGKAIGVPLGRSIHDKILPAIEGYKQENKKLELLAEAAKNYITSLVYWMREDEIPSVLYDTYAEDVGNARMNYEAMLSNVPNPERSVATNDAQSNNAG